MKDELEKAIKVLIEKARYATDSSEAERYSQAVRNLGDVIAGLKLNRN